MTVDKRPRSAFVVRASAAWSPISGKATSQTSPREAGGQLRHGRSVPKQAQQGRCPLPDGAVFAAERGDERRCGGLIPPSLEDVHRAELAEAAQRGQGVQQSEAGFRPDGVERRLGFLRVAAIHAVQLDQEGLHLVAV